MGPSPWYNRNGDGVKHQTTTTVGPGNNLGWGVVFILETVSVSFDSGLSDSES